MCCPALPAPALHPARNPSHWSQPQATQAMKRYRAEVIPSALVPARPSTCLQQFSRCRNCATALQSSPRAHHMQLPRRWHSPRGPRGQDACRSDQCTFNKRPAQQMGATKGTTAGNRVYSPLPPRQPCCPLPSEQPGNLEPPAHGSAHSQGPAYPAQAP